MPPRYQITKKAAPTSTNSPATITLGTTFTNNGSGNATSNLPSTALRDPFTIAMSNEDKRIVEYSSPDDVCPVCRTDRYFQPKLRLMVSSCFHKMCEGCIERLFSLGPSPCPVCGTTIRKTGFKPQLFEDLKVQQEIMIRKRVARVFGAKIAGENTVSRELNDWLEEGEALTFDLLSKDPNIVAQAENKLTSLERTHQLLIENAMSAAEIEAELLKQREEEERMARKFGRDESERVAKEREELIRKGKEGVIQSLESSAMDTDEIISSFNATLPDHRLISLLTMPTAPPKLVEEASQIIYDPDWYLENSETWFERYESVLEGVAQSGFVTGGFAGGYGDLGNGRSGGSASGFWEDELNDKCRSEAIAGLWCQVK